MNIKALLADTDASQRALESYGYKAVSWAEFSNAVDRPAGLMARALFTAKEVEHSYVIYDPEDNADGWLLLGERAEIVKETVEHLIDIEPPTGPLSRKELSQ